MAQEKVQVFSWDLWWVHFESYCFLFRLCGARLQWAEGYNNWFELWTSNHNISVKIQSIIVERPLSAAQTTGCFAVKGACMFACMFFCQRADRTTTDAAWLSVSQADHLHQRRFRQQTTIRNSVRRVNNNYVPREVRQRTLPTGEVTIIKCDHGEAVLFIQAYTCTSIIQLQFCSVARCTVHLAAAGGPMSAAQNPLRRFQFSAVARTWTLNCKNTRGDKPFCLVHIFVLPFL